jgi:hypothetical protein
MQKKQIFTILCITHMFTFLKAQDDFRNPFIYKSESQGCVICAPFPPVKTLQKTTISSIKLGLSKQALQERIALSRLHTPREKYKPMTDNERERTIHVLMMVSKKALPSGYQANDYDNTQLMDNDYNHGIACMNNILKKLKKEEIKLCHAVTFTSSVVYRLSNRITALEHASQDLLYQICNIDDDISNESDKLYETQLEELKKMDAERKHHNTALTKLRRILNSVSENITLHEVMIYNMQNIRLKKREIENAEWIERKNLLHLFTQEKNTIEDKKLYAPKNPLRVITNYPMLSAKKRQELKRL